LSYLQEFADKDADDQESSHILLTTHNPMAIAELEREQVQILHRNGGEGEVRAENPAVDPKGMGYSGIITSDMFGLGSSLDSETNNDLVELHRLSTKAGLNEEELNDLKALRERLATLDFNFASRDRLEQEYLRARFDLSEDGSFESAVVTPENKQKALDALVQSLISKLKDEAD
jgi:hypothetical protein